MADFAEDFLGAIAELIIAELLCIRGELGELGNHRFRTRENWEIVDFEHKIFDDMIIKDRRTDYRGSFMHSGRTWRTWKS